MKRVLIAEEKHGETAWDASTTVKLKSAFLALFRHFDEQGYYYDTPPKWLSTYEKAKAGDHAAAERICYSRRDYEYEGFRVVEVLDPMVEER